MVLVIVRRRDLSLGLGDAEEKHSIFAVWRKSVRLSCFLEHLRKSGLAEQIGCRERPNRSRYGLPTLPARAKGNIQIVQRPLHLRLAGGA